jgi:hypothetical protein
MFDKKLFIRAVISGFVWGTTYLYIRRYLNPENNKNINKFKMDALYGGIASFCGVFITHFLTQQFLT